MNDDVRPCSEISCIFLSVSIEHEEKFVDFSMRSITIEFIESFFSSHFPSNDYISSRCCCLIRYLSAFATLSYVNNVLIFPDELKLLIYRRAVYFCMRFFSLSVKNIILFLTQLLYFRFFLQFVLNFSFIRLLVQSLSLRYSFSFPSFLLVVVVIVTIIISLSASAPSLSSSLPSRPH